MGNRTLSPSYIFRCPYLRRLREIGKKIKKSTFLIFFDRFLDCDFLHNFARKRKFTPILV